jgi:hypothetical protein
MSQPEPLRVTFDTNVCNVIHDPDRWPDQVDPEDARKIREAIRNGKMLGFVSEATLFIECLSFEDKLAYLAVVGTTKPRPVPDPRAVTRFEDVAKVGAKLLHAPLIAGEIFIETFGWASDDVYSIEDRQARFGNFCCSRDSVKLDGLAKLREYGATLDAKFPHTFHGTPMTGPLAWASAFRRAWEADPAGQKKLRKEVGPIIGEWCDGLIVASHIAYGNDVFCTIDYGRNAGANSMLHQSSRAALETQGIKIMTPAELVGQYGF